METVRDGLETVPRFLKQAAGFREGCPVVVTFYGGSGSRHLRWRPEADGGGALPVVWDEAVYQKVEERLLSELEEGRQLGFVAGVGGSKKSQITHVYGLRAEIDLPDSHELQRQVYAAVEERYGIRFTLLDTGGKSLHAWIPAAEAIPVDHYSETSKRWHERIKDVAREAGLDLPEEALDAACHRPTQVMRLPGAVHRKSGKVAKVIQWGEGPVELEALGLAWPEVEEWTKRTAVPRSIAVHVLARICEGGQFLGLSGDARIDELVNLARAVPVRVPGGGTYGTVLSLVRALSRALGAETAAEVLQRAGHLDKEGRSSLDGLRQWCGTFEPDSERGAELLAWLAAWAEREHGWQRPVLHLQGVLQPTELVEPTPAAISEALWSMGGAMVVCRTVFVAGGRTLPPNICGGQAGRRERTATTCVSYVPKTAWDRSLPLLGREVEAIRQELRQAREHAADLSVASCWEIDLLERVYVLAAQRQIKELALFRDYTLHYASVDGWATEELAAVDPLPRLKGAGGKREKRTEPISYRELDPWRQLLVHSLRLQAAGAEREVAENKAEAMAATKQARVGSAGADLLSANLAEVQDLLLSAGLGRLCDGEHRAGDDALVKSVAEALQTSEAARMLRNATWLQVDLKGTGAKPARTIGTVMRSLGGIAESKKVGPRGAQQHLYRWVLPGQR